MSYLLDALNKSRGDGSNPAMPPQPTVYQQGSFSSEEGVNIYKWISIILALILTLLAGIVLGNKYSLLTLTAPPPSVTPQIVQVAAPVVTQTPAPMAKTTANTETTPEPSVKVDKPTPAVTDSKPEVKVEPAKVVAEQHVVSGDPRKLKPVGALKNTGLDGISDDLLKKFNQAIKQSEGAVVNGNPTPPDLKLERELETYFTQIPLISELTAEQQQAIPTLTYQTHLYSSDPRQRWVKINNKTLQESQWLNDNIQVVEIQKQLLIVEMGHLRFSLPALEDWQGVH